MLATVEHGSILSDAEIDAICDPLVQHAAQVKHLQRLGMRVGRKPNGRALVARSEFERAMCGQPIAETAAAASPAASPAAANEPDRNALVLMFNKRRARGSQAQK